jgi:hypothetical protein
MHRSLGLRKVAHAPFARQSSSRKQRRVHLNVEPLEARVTPSTTITVNETSAGRISYPEHPMSIKLQCAECATVYDVDDDLAGKTIRCRESHGLNRVPSPATIAITLLKHLKWHGSQQGNTLSGKVARLLWHRFLTHNHLRRGRLSTLRSKVLPWCPELEPCP